MKVNDEWMCPPPLLSCLWRPSSTWVGNSPTCHLTCLSSHLSLISPVRHLTCPSSHLFVISPVCQSVHTFRHLKAPKSCKSMCRQLDSRRFLSRIIHVFILKSVRVDFVPCFSTALITSCAPSTSLFSHTRCLISFTCLPVCPALVPVTLFFASLSNRVSLCPPHQCLWHNRYSLQELHIHVCLAW